MGYRFMTSPERDSILSPVAYAQFTKLQGQTETIEEKLNNIVAKTLDKAYPIGYIYINTTAADPHDLLGFGTWEKVAKGQTIIGVGDNRDLFGCETMTTTDGAEWAKIMSQTSFFASREQALDCTSGDNWSRLGKINNFIAKNGCIEMILKYIYSDGTEYASRWQQRSTFLNDNYSKELVDTPSQLPGFTITSQASSYQEGLFNGFGSHFKGLNRSWGPYNTIAHGTLESTNQAHYPVGQYGNIASPKWVGLKGYQGSTEYDSQGLSGTPIRTELWVRCDNIHGKYELNKNITSNHVITLKGQHMLPHTHTVSNTSRGVGNTSNSNNLMDYLRYGSSISEYSLSSVGGGQGHNNMSPYLSVSIWKRVA